MSGLPTGWAETEIGQIAQIETGSTPSKKDASLYGREVCFYKPGDLDIGGVISISNDMVSKAGAEAGRILPASSLLVTCIGNLGKSALIAEPAICNQQINAVLPSRAVEPHYLYYWSRTIKPWLEENSSATTVSIINKGRFSKAPIRIAPINEQRRIVAKIDSLTGKSKRARDHLDHIPRLVEKYKQAILAAAFRGELLGLTTEECDHPHQRCWDLPKSWRWVSFSDMVEISSNLRKPEEISELPHIAPDNVEGGTGRLLPYRTIGEDGVISAKHRFYAGQVIYSKIRPYLRKAVLVDFDGACSADMYPLTPSQNINAKYLLYWLISEPFAGFTFEHEGRSVLPKINQKGLSQTPLPLPPISDQLEIVRRVESAFNWVDRLSADSTCARKLIDHLDQAVLTKAFAGELVPQDPSDEPASVLLDHIRVERAAAPKTKRGRKTAG